MKEKFYLKILSKKLVLICFLMSQILMGGEREIITYQTIYYKKAIIISNYGEISNFDPLDPNISFPLYTLFVRLYNEKKFKLHAIYSKPIKDISWDSFEIDRFHVKFADKTKVSYSMAEIVLSRR